VIFAHGASFGAQISTWALVPVSETETRRANTDAAVPGVLAGPKNSTDSIWNGNNAITGSSFSNRKNSTSWLALSSRFGSSRGASAGVCLAAGANQESLPLTVTVPVIAFSVTPSIFCTHCMRGPWNMVLRVYNSVCVSLDG